ncbi:MAG TPA: ketose-bisphosphate aldolase [Candidatus Sumerlaeota bacterium]|nr:MAG: Fructose-bisphosphate aldolase [candidate division BRC1 bacterium ADurb.Bin183]HOE62938.1 ketose-bisphosphate aldolase [Candidatus Sumerlaeota bacterium]HRR31881.1 ketose-bisphosphate aldolase [Candidatus Sumerlaeia bacterium]HON50286.1 ketose-bisphosphate aldolase [Candidatus Sumerlaeota bacterium]HOR63502.1 ketose-bisphosphate aldolase [Candidatus Sumerlaeota bacterium]
MALVTLKQILDEAEKGGYGVGAFNVNNMEQIQGIFNAAQELESPLIIQASFNAVKYAGLKFLQALMKAAVETYPDVPVALHLDHGPDFDRCKTCIELGFTSVMIDGSLDYSSKEKKKPARSFEENVRVTKEVVDYAHSFGVSVEGELGTLGGVEDDAAAAKVMFTDPDQAVEFVKQTGVDCLAVAIGTSHGAYKFKEKPIIDIDRVKTIHSKIPEIPLVMHGSSSVPAELTDKLNNYIVVSKGKDDQGGPFIDFLGKKYFIDRDYSIAKDLVYDLFFKNRLKKTMGVPIESIQMGIMNGVRKINVDTDGRLMITTAVLDVLHAKPEKFDPRDYLTPARDAVYNMVKGKILAFGSAGHAKDYKPKTLAQMKKFYEST